HVVNEWIYSARRNIMVASQVKRRGKPRRRIQPLKPAAFQEVSEWLNRGFAHLRALSQVELNVEEIEDRRRGGSFDPCERVTVHLSSHSTPPATISIYYR